MNILENKVVAVTGGCGFIGSFLLKELLNIGVSKIIIIDDCSYGNKNNINLDDERIFLNDISLNIANIDDIAIAIDGADYLFHLAAEKYNQSKNNPLSIIDSNISGTIKIAESCLRVGVKKIVFSSSLYAYGKIKTLKLGEKLTPDPHTIYGISKLAGEQIIKQYHHKAFNFNILRYFFVYGPNQFAGSGYKSVIIKNFERMLASKPPIINGDGLQTLDYSYVDDIVQGTISAMVIEDNNHIINLGSGIPITIKDLIQMMKKIANFNGDTLYREEDETAGTVRVCEIKKAKEILNYQPKINIDEGLRRTYDWLKNE